MNTVPSVEAELAGIDVGDKRLDRRAVVIAKRIAANPKSSFPKMVGNDSELEGLYRFFQNESVDPDALLEPHRVATKLRCESSSIVRVSHDTTGLKFRGNREGIGLLGRRGTGFYAHVSLAIGDGEEREPLGVLGCETFVRTLETRRSTPSAQVARTRATPREKKESARWLAGVRTAEELQLGVPIIHVMDQEADDFALFAELMAIKARFVIRGSADRRLVPSEPENVRDELDARKSKLLRTIALVEKVDAHSNDVLRGERTAELRVRGVQLTLERPKHAQSKVKSLTLNVVQVFEPKPPKGEEAIEWTLYTTEAIDTVEEMAAIVDHYRARWRAEELFKALKTGCSFEERQLTDYDALVRALALFMPIAWQLLALRVLSRLANPPKASVLFSDEDVAVVRWLAEQRRRPLPSKPTVRDIMHAIAAVGGHLKRNGDPGWITIGRGYQDFLLARRAWSAAKAEM